MKKNISKTIIILLIIVIISSLFAKIGNILSDGEGLFIQINDYSSIDKSYHIFYDSEAQAITQEIELLLEEKGIDDYELNVQEHHISLIAEIDYAEIKNAIGDMAIVENFAKKQIIDIDSANHIASYVNIYTLIFNILFIVFILIAFLILYEAFMRGKINSYIFLMALPIVNLVYLIVGNNSFIIYVTGTNILMTLLSVVVIRRSKNDCIKEHNKDI